MLNTSNLGLSIKRSSFYRRSFTLIEVVFAAGLIIMFLAALISLFNISSRNVVVSKHQLQAANLAREGAEYMRYARDSCWKFSSTCIPWNSTLAAKAAALSVVIGPVNSVSFTRTVSVTYPNTAGCPSASCARVVSTVQWADFSSTNNHSVTMTTYLTNWKNP